MLRPKLISVSLLEIDETPHRHTHTEIAFVASGSGKLDFEKQVYPLRAGDFVLLNCGTLHAIAADKNARVVSIGVDNLRLEGGNILKNNTFCIVPSGDEYTPLSVCFESLLRETSLSLEYANALTARYLQIIILYVLRLAESDVTLTYNKLSAYLRVKAYFDDHFTEAIDIQSVCDDLCVNRYYLSHLFKAQTGQPPMRYINGKRLAHAEKLLISSDLDINEIARICGFYDASYFCRMFKNAHQVTPLQFRYNSKLNK